jgi:hypothetical protein
VVFEGGDHPLLGVLTGEKRVRPVPCKNSSTAWFAYRACDQMARTFSHSSAARSGVGGPIGADCGVEHLAVFGSSPSWNVQIPLRAAVPDLCFYTARWYSLMRPPRTARCLIYSSERAATG